MDADMRATAKRERNGRFFMICLKMGGEYEYAGIGGGLLLELWWHGIGTSEQELPCQSSVRRVPFSC